MEITSQEDHHNMPIPLNTTFVGASGGGGGHGHMIHHHNHNHHHATNSAPPTHNTTTQPPQIPLHGNGHGNNHDHHHHHVGNFNSIINNKKPMIKYKECLKNHAASMGGNAIDGCGEFMPSGEDGSIESLTCSACSCHRNFHRKEVEGETAAATAISSYHQTPQTRKHNFNNNNNNLSIRSAMPHQMIMPMYMHNNNNSDDHSDDFMEEDGVTTVSRPVIRPLYNQKKRFRTKFTPEQKEKMLSFAEKSGWKIQRQEDSVVQKFCEEIGVKRRVLKVWMHNNKLHFNNKKNDINLEDNDNDPKINNLNDVDMSCGNNDITKTVT